MLQQRKVISITKYQQIDRIIPAEKYSWLEAVKDVVLGVIAIACFIIGLVSAFGA